MTLSVQFEVGRPFHELLVDRPQLATNPVLLINVQYLGRLPVAVGTSVAGNSHKWCGLVRIRRFFLVRWLGHRESVRIVLRLRRLSFLEFQVGHVKLETHELLGPVVAVQVNDARVCIG